MLMAVVGFKPNSLKTASVSSAKSLSILTWTRFFCYYHYTTFWVSDQRIKPWPQTTWGWHWSKGWTFELVSLVSSGAHLKAPILLFKPFKSNLSIKRLVSLKTAKKGFCSLLGLAVQPTVIVVGRLFFFGVFGRIFSSRLLIPPNAK